MIRRSIFACAIAALILPQPAAAQFGSLLNGIKSSSSSSSSSSGSGGCEKGKSRSKSGSILGGMLGNMAGSAIGSTAIGRFVPIPEVTGILTDAIACRLDETEQKQAAAATSSATRTAEVGSTASWKSDTRPDVSGTSTVTAKTASADGGSCLTVTDVIIVNGEETTVPKKMCRKSGTSGYTLAA
jgi:surface antigen